MVAVLGAFFITGTRASAFPFTSTDDIHRTRDLHAVSGNRTWISQLWKFAPVYLAGVPPHAFLNHHFLVSTGVYPPDLTVEEALFLKILI